MDYFCKTLYPRLVFLFICQNPEDKPKEKIRTRKKRKKAGYKSRALLSSIGANPDKEDDKPGKIKLIDARNRLSV